MIFTDAYRSAAGEDAEVHLSPSFAECSSVSGHLPSNSGIPTSISGISCSRLDMRPSPSRLRRMGRLLSFFWGWTAPDENVRAEVGAVRPSDRATLDANLGE